MRIGNGVMIIGQGIKDMTYRDEVRLCGTPLFSEKERAHGICQKCMDGWEVVGNRLATADEAAEYQRNTSK